MCRNVSLFYLTMKVKGCQQVFAVLRFSGEWVVTLMLGVWCAAAQAQSGPAGREASVVNIAELAARGRETVHRPARKRPARISREGRDGTFRVAAVDTAARTNPQPAVAESFFTAASAPPSPPPSASFLALPDNAVAFNPDTSGAVGQNHLMVTLGSEVRIQNRSGGVVSTISIDAFWGALGNSNVFDPRVLYDSAKQRWITTAIANPATNNASLLLAVSQSSDPTGNWYRHQIRVDLVDGVYAESPNIGLSRDWIVVSANMLDKTGLFYTRAEIFAFNRTNLYAGGGAQFSRFPFAPSGQNLSEINIPVPAVNLDESYSTNFLVANWDGSFGGGAGLQAMMVDEMAVVPEKAEAMLDELLASSRELLPQFRTG